MTRITRGATDEALRRIVKCRREGERGKSLDLSGLGMATLPPEIGLLFALKTLDLSNNCLSTLPPKIGLLSALTELDVSNNELSTLPPEIGQLSALTHLFLHGNPLLALPPSVLGPDVYDCKRRNGKLAPARPADILDYYFDTIGSEGRALREVKVILVGRGEVGKSSMVDALLGKKFVKNRPSTDGVSITTLPVTLPDGTAELTLWDFGGQEIMHGTHQFFMTHRSLYVVMVDGRHDRGKQDAEYWLRLARAFGGDSPILVVMNRQKAHPFDIDREAIAKKHGVLLEHFFRTDCEAVQTIKPLKAAILVQAAAMLAAEERFPARCWDVKTRLAAMKENGEDYFSEACYRRICVEHGVEEEEQKKLLRRLADLGTVVSFPDELKMAELSVLNPAWATESIYRVVTNEKLREVKHGLLTRAELRNILPRERWPNPLHVNYVMDLMVKFELCFPVDGGADEMLVPELLPDKTPPQGDWEPQKCLVFQYDYPILPHGVLPRFITRTHLLSQGRQRWRTGVVLADDGTEARLQADYEANTITVWLRGRHIDARRALLKVIRSHFESIHARIEALNPEEMVAVPGHPDVMVSYRDAVLDERRGKIDIAVTVGGKRIDQPLPDLLNGVEPRKERVEAALLEKYLTLGDKRNINIEKLIMNDDYSINLRDNNQGQVGQTLTDCKILVQQMPAGTLREMLETLTEQLGPVRDEMKGKDIRVVDAQVTTLVEEANKPAAQRDRGLIATTAKGLIEASETVGKIAGPLIATVKGIASLLGVG